MKKTGKSQKSKRRFDEKEKIFLKKFSLDFCIRFLMV